MTVLHRLAHEDAGQDIVEYALLAALVGVTAILVWEPISNIVADTYGDATGIGGDVQGLSACTPDPGGGGCGA